MGCDPFIASHSTSDDSRVWRSSLSTIQQLILQHRGQANQVSSAPFIPAHLLLELNSELFSIEWACIMDVLNIAA
jgi:hypothetical protein